MTAVKEDAGRLREAVLAVVKERGYLRLAEPIELASGEYSLDFVDAKQALARGDDLALACRAFLALLADGGIDFDAVGGLTMGADQFAHGMALVGGRSWFVVRKVPKGRGTDKRIEGAPLGPGVRVVVVDDVVTTGGSIREALDVVSKTGAVVVAAITLLDRGDNARPFFEACGVPYLPLLTYADLGIEPVGVRGGGRGGT